MVALIKAILLVVLSGLALAIPAPTKTSPAEKRTISGVTGADCGGFTFTADQVAAAASAAASHIASDSVVGSNKYPHVFNNRFTFDDGCNPPFFEFPVFPSKVYTGGSPGADRVIVGSVSGSDAAFCAVDVITHRGATGNGFLQCDNA
ncbi:hypothetical protein FRC08_001610 [Ceratobasidium sp. 394]|nr:hypothetical protein FRC08_001610 [Ceratobasidium sp. 394]